MMRQVLLHPTGLNSVASNLIYTQIIDGTKTVTPAGISAKPSESLLIQADKAVVLIPNYPDAPDPYMVVYLNTT